MDKRRPPDRGKRDFVFSQAKEVSLILRASRINWSVYSDLPKNVLNGIGYEDASIYICHIDIRHLP